MAKVLFFLQLIVALVVLPLLPGLDPRFVSWGLVFLAVVLALPLAAVLAVLGPSITARALAEVWSAAPVDPRSKTPAAWALASGVFPLSGILAGLTALVGPLMALDPQRPWTPQILLLSFFCLVWGILGLLLSRILHGVSVTLSEQTRPLLTLTPAFSRRFGLTPREAESAQAVLDGLTYKDAGDRLAIQPATLKSHVLSVYQKTGTGNKIELLRLVEVENTRLHQSVDGRNEPADRS